MGSHHPRSFRTLSSNPACGALALTALGLFSTGCAHPNKANIELRKQNAALEQRVTDLQRQHDIDLATIRGLQGRTGVLPTLPQDRLDKLFTVGSMKITRLTGGANLDHEDGPDNGIRAFVQLFDNTGDLIKSAGTFTVEVFDLKNPDHPLVAKRTFPVEQADSLWSPMPLVYSFVLPVPWTSPPKHDELTVKITFVDELTQRVLTGQTIVHVNLSTAPRPTSQPTSTPR